MIIINMGAAVRQSCRDLLGPCNAQDMVIIGYGDTPTNKTTTVNDSFEAIQISTPSTA